MKIKDGFVGDSNVTADQPKWKHKNSWHDLMMMVFLSLERIPWSLSFTKLWVFLPWQRRCHQSREVWWLWVGPEVFWNLEEQPSWNQQIEIFKNGQLENCHGCPFYQAEEGSAINKSKLRCLLIFLSKGAQDISSGHSTNKMPSSFTTFSTHICSSNFPVNSFNIQHFSPCNRLSSRQLLSKANYASCEQWLTQNQMLTQHCWVFKSKSEN